MFSVAKSFDSQQCDSGIRDLSFSCKAWAAKDASLGYLSDDYFMLRLELRTRRQSNESVTFNTRQLTALCQVSIRKALSIAKKQMMPVEHQTCMGDEPIYVKK